MENLIIYGDFLYATEFDKMCSFENGYMVVKDGIIIDIFKEIPTEYKQFKIKDFSGKVIIPAFCDMHLHAPQFYQRGIGMDLKLIDWLNTYTFPNESRFEDVNYACEVYKKFVDNLVLNGSLSSSIFATIHNNACGILYKMLDEKGLNAFVGKVNMDQNSPEILCETTEDSIKDTIDFVENYSYSDTVKPIITPRFSPSCTEKLHKALGEIAQEKNVCVQSHLCESVEEIDWVMGMFPHYDHYAHIYHKNGLFGQTKTLMAHCVHLNDDEIQLMKKQGVYAVHCPDSNINILSGIMPVRKLVEQGVKVVLGSDIGGGESMAMNKTMANAIKSSKILEASGHKNSIINVTNVLYMATKAAGEFFGKVGSFESGYDATFLVLDDENLKGFDVSNEQRLERFLYIGDDRNIISRYIKGKSI